MRRAEGGGESEFGGGGGGDDGGSAGERGDLEGEDGDAAGAEDEHGLAGFERLEAVESCPGRACCYGQCTSLFITFTIPGR